MFWINQDLEEAQSPKKVVSGRMVAGVIKSLIHVRERERERERI